MSSNDQQGAAFSGAGNVVVVNFAAPDSPLVLSDPSISPLNVVAQAGNGAFPLDSTKTSYSGSFGAVVAASGRWLVSTAELDNTLSFANNGRAYLYELSFPSSSAPVLVSSEPQVANPVAYYEENYFGWSAAIVATNSVSAVAIGAPEWYFLLEQYPVGVAIDRPALCTAADIAINNLNGNCLYPAAGPGYVSLYITSSDRPSFNVPVTLVSGTQVLSSCALIAHTHTHTFKFTHKRTLTHTNSLLPPLCLFLLFFSQQQYGDSFGAAVALSVTDHGNFLAVGAPYATLPGVTSAERQQQGLVYVYTFNADGGIQLSGSPLAPPSSSFVSGNYLTFGWSVALSKSGLLAVGAPFGDGNNDMAVYVPGNIFASSEATIAYFPVQTTLSKGKAFVYDVTSPSLSSSSLLEAFEAPTIGSFSNTKFGFSVAISDNYLAISEPGFCSESTPILSCPVGQVFVFHTPSPPSSSGPSGPKGIGSRPLVIGAFVSGGLAVFGAVGAFLFLRRKAKHFVRLEQVDVKA